METLTGLLPCVCELHTFPTPFAALHTSLPNNLPLLLRLKGAERGSDAGTVFRQSDGYPLLDGGAYKVSQSYPQSMLRQTDRQ